MRAIGAFFIAASLVCGAASSNAADPVESFYAGKTVTLLIGYSAGGGYDTYARVLARHMGSHIPGNPTIVPQNMPGAGSLRATNYLYEVAPRDGSVFGTFSRGEAMEPLLHPDSAKYDSRKFTWIGSVTNEVSICGFWHTTGLKTWNDLLKSPGFTVGGTGSGSDTDIFPIVFDNMFHMHAKLVTGYPGGADVVLAMERGEINGRCGWSWTTLMSRNKDLYETKQIYIPVQVALKKHEDLPNVPLILDLTKDPKQIAAMKLIFSRQSMARPFAAPPGIPADRASALRAAFDATMKDPAFIEDAKKSDLEVRPATGQEIEDLVTEIYDSPPEVLKLARDAIAEPH